ncbi:hypothetical protein IMG5_110380 [Ichthyophthirius multifiliis]|uniref:Transmembrane protein n=1 Tax=Ichthyophthirius multifiliis TaxID=5932 RepID=G0QTP9_ICHMU|nr:hypothetical protein IMG5_110380 [Ichthyophthirius multifiliis]EGR31422.1 hypothetical protein IMG5_110380 [Ichthyophthirius multifiliis]|eukprot:XP_004034908.1 hypothetical protein IMG5_110380 [Ichthyophthirius multifiliis]
MVLLMKILLLNMLLKLQMDQHIYMPKKYLFLKLNIIKYQQTNWELQFQVICITIQDILKQTYKMKRRIVWNKQQFKVNSKSTNHIKNQRKIIVLLWGKFFTKCCVDKRGHKNQQQTCLFIQIKLNKFKNLKQRVNKLCCFRFASIL